KKGRELEFDVSENAPSRSQSVDDLIRTCAAKKRSEFIQGITSGGNGQRRILRSLHYFNITAPQREQALRLLTDYQKRFPEPPSEDFFEVEDACGRVAGIGSMGRFRYVVLVAGKGKRDARNVLIEFKEARPSAYVLYRQRETDPKALAARAER